MAAHSASPTYTVYTTHPTNPTNTMRTSEPTPTPTPTPKPKPSFFSQMKTAFGCSSNNQPALGDSLPNVGQPNVDQPNVDQLYVDQPYYLASEPSERFERFDGRIHVGIPANLQDQIDFLVAKLNEVNENNIWLLMRHDCINDTLAAENAHLRHLNDDLMVENTGLQSALKCMANAIAVRELNDFLDNESDSSAPVII